MCYSESKKKDRTLTPLANKSNASFEIRGDADNTDEEEASPLEMLRYALLKLSSLEETSAAGAGGSGAGASNISDIKVLTTITSLLQVIYV